MDLEKKLPGIKRTIEGDTPVLSIVGFENDPKNYKKIYDTLIKTVQRSHHRFVPDGKNPPVVRILGSIEIH